MLEINTEMSVATIICLGQYHRQIFNLTRAQEFHFFYFKNNILVQILTTYSSSFFIHLPTKQ